MLIHCGAGVGRWCASECGGRRLIKGVPVELGSFVCGPLLGDQKWYLVLLLYLIIILGHYIIVMPLSSENCSMCNINILNDE